MNKEEEIDLYLNEKKFSLLTNEFKQNFNSLSHTFISNLLIKIIMAKYDVLLNELLANIDEINFFDKNKRTLLMYSCLINDDKIFNILFKKKQNFNSQDLLKNNTLHFAVKFYGMKRNYSNFDKIKKLLTTKININSVNFFNQSPLMFAAIYNNENILEYLCKKGADPNIANGWGDFTPLMTAVRLNNKDLVQTIIDKNVNIDDSNTIFGYNALDIAKAFNFKEIEEILNRKLNK
jgi:ankyrin repeat protein